MSLAPPASLARAAGPSAPAAPPSPPIARVRRPRWRDSRLLVGILLVLVSVGVGARVVSGAQQTGSWVAVAHDLPAGHVLADGDLTVTSAHLIGAGAARYFRAERSRDLLGHPIVHGLGVGDLVPRDAVTYLLAPASRVVPVIVKAGRLPALSVGDHVDVYVLDRAPAATPSPAPAGTPESSASGARELLVLPDVEYLGATAVGSGDTSVQLRVTPAAAAGAVAASQSERVDLVRVDADASVQRGSGPTSVPAYGS